jgi:nucleotide-binding universal stress UspA family protein
MTGDVTTRGTAVASTRYMKRMLVALDASPRAPAVLAAAAHLAEMTNVTIVLYRAIAAPPDARDAIADLERLARGVPRAHIEKISATFATPWGGICRAARDYVADIIVMGAGATAGDVLEHADRNVLVLSESQEAL